MTVRSDLTVDWNASPRIVTVAAPSTEITIQDLYDTLRFLEYTFQPGYDVLAEPFIVGGEGKVEFKTGLATGITLTLQNAKLAFEARGGPTWVECFVDGGNLAAVDDVGAFFAPIKGTAYVTTAFAQSTEAALLAGGGGSATDGMIWLDAIDGDDANTGLSDSPVETLAAVAALIAGGDARRIVRITGSYQGTLAATENWEGIEFIGDNPAKVGLARAGYEFDGCTFRDLFINGVEDGAQTIPNSYYRCRIAGTMGSLFAWDSMFVGACVFYKTAAIKLVRCSSHGALDATAFTTFGWTGTGTSGSLGATSWSGDVELGDLDEVLTGIWWNQVDGKLRLATSITAAVPVVLSGSGGLDNPTYAIYPRPAVTDRRVVKTVNTGEWYLSPGGDDLTAEGTRTNPIAGRLTAFAAAVQRADVGTTLVVVDSGGNIGDWIQCDQGIIRGHIKGDGHDTSGVLFGTGGYFYNCLVEDLRFYTDSWRLDHSELWRCLLGNSTVDPNPTDDTSMADVTMIDCTFEGGDVFLVGLDNTFINCHGQPGTWPPQFWFGETYGGSARFQNWRGNIAIRADGDSPGGNRIEVNCNGGTVTIEAETIDTYEIIVTGDCLIDDLSGGVANITDARQDGRLNEDHGSGSWEQTQATVDELVAAILKGQMSPWRKHVDSVANALSLARDMEGGKQLVTATGGGQLETFEDDNTTPLADFETYDKNDARTDSATAVVRRDRIADTTTGDEITWGAAAANSSSVLNMADEADLIFEGRFSNGAIPILKPYGTADTDVAGAEYWVAPTAANGIVGFRLLHTGTQAAHSGLTMHVLGGSPLPDLIELGPYSFAAVGGADVDAFLYEGPADSGTPITELQDEADGGQWAWSDDGPPSGSGTVGPTTGSEGDPDGYIYTESSSPAGVDDEFYCEKEDADSPGVPYTFPASLYAVVVDFRTCQRGTECDATLDVETNVADAGWVSRFQCGGPSDPNKVLDGGAQIWAERQVDLTGVISANARIRFRVTMPSAGTVFRNDYGVDYIKFTMTKI